MQISWNNVLFACLACTCSIAFAVEENYVGLSYKYRHMSGRSSTEYSYSTVNVLPSNYNGGEIYFAHRFDNDVGVHIAYEQSQNKQQNTVFANNEEFLGNPQHAGDFCSIRNRIDAVQFDMVGYLDLLKKIEAIGQFGFSVMNAHMSGTITAAGVTSNLAPSKSYNFIPTIGLGIQYFLQDRSFGMRLLVDWEGTNYYRMNMTDDDGIRHTIRPFTQSWCVTLGLVARFRYATNK